MDLETIFYVLVVIILYFILYVCIFRYFYISNKLLIPPIETFTFEKQPDRNYYYTIKKKHNFSSKLN